VLFLLVGIADGEVFGGEQTGSEDPFGDGRAVDAGDGGKGDGGGGVEGGVEKVVDAGGEELD
jgi:hypothetical protein